MNPTNPTNPPGWNQPPPPWTQPPGWQQPPPPPPPPTPKTDGLAVASLVSGIVWALGFGSLLAVVFGHIAMRRTRREHRPGHGLALAGTILGYAGLGLLALTILVAAAGGSSDSSPAARSHATVSPVASASCTDQALAWRDGGAADLLKRISADLGTAVAPALSDDLAGTQAAMPALVADAGQLRRNLPPACIPGMRDDLLIAANDLTAAGQGVMGGDITDIAAAAQQMDAAGSAIMRGTRDLTRWEAAGQP
jgi:Domain of unknown function (DUF4190)